MIKSMLGGLLGTLLLVGCAGSQKPAAAVQVQNVPTPVVSSSVEKPIGSAPDSTHEAITPQAPEPEVRRGCH